MNMNNTGSVYYGMHFAEGVAEYRDKDKDPYRVFISNDTAKKMDPTFEGKPMFIGHVEDENAQAPHGYVVESFFNQVDGKHWAKFIVTSEEAKDKIRNGWKLSNSYSPTGYASGGLWHGVEYFKEVTEGVYAHLAIVNDPRYSESIILTPEQFKAYNSEKESELSKLTNSLENDNQGEATMNFFKRTKIDNASDFENTMVELPTSKKQLSISQIVNALDKIENMNGYANGDHMVKVGDEEMSVNEMAERYGKMKNAEAAALEEKKKNESAAAEEEKKKNEVAEEEKKKNEAAEEEKKKNEAAEKEKGEKNFNSLANANDINANEAAISASGYGVTLGKKLF